MNLSLQTNWYLITFCLIAVLLSLFFSYRNYKNAVRHHIRILFMETLRTLAVVLAAFTILRPEIVTKTILRSDPEIAIVNDVSGSMETQDLVIQTAGTPTAIKRKEWVDEQPEAKFYEPLAKKFKVSIESFSMPPSSEDPEKTAKDGTDLDYALSNMLTGYNNLRAVILFSDGDWNAGKSPIGAAAKLRARGTKVYAIPTGSSGWLPDIEFKKVRAPAFCLSNEKISIPFQIQSRMKKEFHTKVTLESEYGVENTKEVILLPGELTQESVIWQPKRNGQYRLTLKVPVQDGELISENNKSSFTIVVKKELLKVLVIDTLPRWEYRYLRNALMRDPGVDVNTLLLHPRLGAGGGKGYLAKFPTKEELSSYDVIFLGDIGISSKEISKENAELIEGVVKHQGSGLVFMPGYQGKQISLLDTPLGDMYPVVLNKQKPEGFSSGIESKMELSGQGRDHFLLMLADSPSMNSYVWRHLPGFFWNAAVEKERPGSNVLAIHSGLKCESGRMPLIVTREYGNGNVLFMGTDSAWRWRKGVEDKYHYRYWGQVVRWMAHKRHLAHDEGIRCFFVPESPREKSKVSLYATLHDRSGRAVDNANVEVTLSSENGKSSTSFKLRQEKEGWGLYKGSFIPETGGIYELAIRCKETGSDIKIKIDVAGKIRERIGQPIRKNSLFEIARITKGAVFKTDELQKLLSTINALPKQIELEKRFLLWCQWWWGAIIIILLSAYWAMRKIHGMI